MIGVLHTTESEPGSIRGVDNYFNNLLSQGFDYRPHQMYDPLTNEWRTYIPPDQNAKALFNAPGGVETNNRVGGVYQLEIVGRAADVGAYSDSWYVNLRGALEALSASLGIAYEFNALASRLTFAEWESDSLRGWLGHCHVPENNHTDPGTLDYNRLAIPPGLAIQSEENDMTPVQLAHALGGELNLMGQVCVPLVADDLVSTDLYTIGQALSFIHQELKMARLSAAARDASTNVDDIKAALKTAIREFVD